MAKWLFAQRGLAIDFGRERSLWWWCRGRGFRMWGSHFFQNSESDSDFEEEDEIEHQQEPQPLQPSWGGFRRRTRPTEPPSAEPEVGVWCCCSICPTLMPCKREIVVKFMTFSLFEVAASSNKKKRCKVCGPKMDRKTRYNASNARSTLKKEEENFAPQ